MAIPDVIAIVGVFVNTLVFYIMYRQFIKLSQQTESLSKQTEIIQKDIQYSAYLRQVEQLNIINRTLIDKDSLSETFKNKLGFDELLKTMSISDIGFSWLVINRYECAFVANELGILPKDEWEAWKRRIKKDFSHPIVRNVWTRDIEKFDYSPGFKKFINDLL